MTTTEVRYQRAAIHSVDDLKAVAEGAGSHFFSPGAMRFFDSRILSSEWNVDGPQTKPGARFVFVTSEVYDDEPRHYKVRIMTLGMQRDNRPSVDIDTVNDERYETAREARMAAQLYVAELKGLVS